MLTDSEWAQINCIVPIGKTQFLERQAFILEAYERLTGFKETNPNAILHHIASQYGLPCESCGKPLRTPKAAFCASCGKSRASRT